MASKRKTTTKGKAAKPAAKKAAAQPEGDHARQVIGEKSLRDLARLSDQCMDRAATASGQLGAAVREYQEKGLDPVAFRIVNRLRRMGQRDPMKLTIVLDNIDYYRDALGIDDMKAKDIPGIVAQRKSGRKPRQTDLSEREDVKPDNVTALDDHRDEDAA